MVALHAACLSWFQFALLMFLFSLSDLHPGVCHRCCFPVSFPGTRQTIDKQNVWDCLGTCCGVKQGPSAPCVSAWKGCHAVVSTLGTVSRDFPASKAFPVGRCEFSCTARLGSGECHLTCGNTELGAGGGHGQRGETESARGREGAQREAGRQPGAGPWSPVIFHVTSAELTGDAG